MNETIYSILRIKLQPGARKDALCEWMTDGTLKVRVKSKPIEGKANENLLKFLSGQLNVRASDIEIKAGGKSRNKVLKIWGLKQEETEKRINFLLGQEP